jgi:hypothetical protein
MPHNNTASPTGTMPISRPPLLTAHFRMEPRVRILSLTHLIYPTLVHLPQALLVNITGVSGAYRYEKGGYFCENHFPSFPHLISLMHALTSTTFSKCREQ